MRSSKSLWRALAVIPPALIFVKFGFSVGTVEGRSMQPTFNPDKNGLRKDWVLLDRYSPARGIYKVGQVVVLTNPNQPNMKLIKRIVALPGDAVRPRQGAGEGIGPGFWTVGKEIEGYITIPKGHCWVESDEPFRGVDSNVFGPVPLGLIDAKVSMVLWPFERFGKVPDIDRKFGRVRWAGQMNLETSDYSLLPS